MAHQLSESEDSDGTRFVVKLGSGSVAVRLRAEGATLALAKHPGVVELISMQDDGEEVTLHLALVTGRNLLDQPALNARQLAAVFAEVAQTVADLHALGIAHTNLGAEHVILGQHLHATLCGFGSASRSEEDLTTGADPNTPAAHDGERLDVIALGRLLDREVTRSLDEQLSEDREPAVIALRHIADLADCATDRTRVVEMQQLARRLHQVAGTTPDDPRQASGVGSAPLLDRLRDRLDGSGRAVGGVLVAAVIATIALAVWPSSEKRLSASDAAVASPTTSVPITVEPTLVLDTSPICDTVASGVRRADVDGDGCDEQWWRVGSVLAVAGERYSLGHVDDLVTIGDWDCDGIATPALVNADTGDVFLFTEWASDGGSTVAELVATVESALTLSTAHSGNCDVLTVSTADGHSHTIGGGA